MLELNYADYPVLETPRLLLRKPVMDDTDLLFQLRTNELTTRYTDRAKLKTYQEAVDKLNFILSMIEKRECIAWIIELKETKTSIGDISFWRFMKEHYRAEIGYSLLPSYWRKGYMTEAAKAAINHGFNALQLHSIEANVNPGNQASISLLEKLKFEKEAYFRENFYYNGKFLDSAIYSLVNH